MRKKLLLFSISILFSIFLLEVGLRLFSYKPGQISYSQWFKKVDSLTDINGFIANEHGIFKMDTSYSSILGTNNETDIDSYIANLMEDDISGELAMLSKDYFEAKSNVIENNFSKKINSIADKNKLSSLDSAILKYTLNPINSDGFHSVEFKSFNSEKKKVLLLGDSFTWGHSTTNKSFSFANELLAKGYIVYNSGISGADVAQYKIIAEKYIPLLQPDVVILNFFMGNDISYYKREPESYHPIFYSTNAGNLMAFQNGIEYYTKEDAYDNLLKNYSIPQTNWSKKLASKTVLTTFAWVVWLKLGMTHNDLVLESEEVLEKPACNEEIEDIVKACNANNSAFQLVVIPDFLYGNVDVEDFPYLFENLEYKMSPITKEDYKLSDGHFNNEGHRKYAEFLDELIKKE